MIIVNIITETSCSEQKFKNGEIKIEFSDFKEKLKQIEEKNKLTR